MKRCRVALLVWLICLSIPLGALSAPYAHVHPDAGHDTNHHDGRQIHRHGPADHHEQPDQPDHHQGSSDSATLNGSAGLVPRIEVVRPAATTLAAPATMGGLPVMPARTSAPLLPPDSDRPPDDPLAHPSPLRGPPR